MKRKQCKYLIGLMLLISSLAHAQHSETFSQYMFNGLILNPGYAGSKEVLVFNNSSKLQWVNVPGAPRSGVISGHLPFKRNKKLAIGAMLSHEEIGIHNDSKFTGSFAYRLPLKVGKLSLGISAGIGYSSSNWQAATTNDEDYILGQGSLAKKNNLRPTFGAGGFYSNKIWYAGYSAPSLLSYNYDSIGNALETSVHLARIEHLLTAGYVHKLNRKVKIKPSFLLKYTPTVGAQVDLNTNLIFQDQYWIGISYRTNDAIVAMLEYNVNFKLKLGYAYDFTISELGQYSLGSHELLIEYGFGMFVRGKSPRQF